MKKQNIIVAAFIVNNDKVLLAKRSSTKRIAPDKYHLPGGHVEFGEHPEHALIREIKEELNLDILVKMPFFTLSYTFDDEHTIGIIYHAVPISPFEEITTNSLDIDHIIWIFPHEIDTYLEKNDHNYQAVLQGYELD